MTCRQWLFLSFLFIALPVLADSWRFGDKIAVSNFAGTDVFQHLEASARKNIAVSGNTLAVVWEDNRNGTPQAYVALKNLDANEFSETLRISTGVSGYGPAILALGSGQFLVGWERENTVWLRTVSTGGAGSAIQISGTEAGQIAFATADGRDVVIVWSEQTGRFNQIMTETIKIGAKGEVIRAGATKPVDSKKPMEDQSYPAVTMTKKGVTVAWEDRRRGHTALYYSHAAPGSNFNAPRLLNEVAQKSDRYGRGSGATRVTLSTVGKDQLVAAWMDKRHYQTAYDIYAAFSQDAGQTFGRNELVQDEFADQYSQWHPAIVGDDSYKVVVAWDDDRDGISNIWMAWKTTGRWSMNYAPPPAASDSMLQTNPAIALDEYGKLHLVWLEQAAENSPGRIMYAAGHYVDDRLHDSGARSAK